MASLEEELGRLGARVSPQWLASCLAFLQSSQPGVAAAPMPTRAKAVLQQLLATDLNLCGAPALPPGVQGLHDTTLPGKLLLQVDEVVNIAAAVRERYSGNDGGQRCLKLLLTDGVQQVAAVEYRPTPALHSAMPAGCKLVVQGATVRRGMLLLTPQCCAVLGGGVARLEDARRRMVVHWTQPAVGRRGPPPTMAQATTEATRAAWAGGPAPGGAGGRPPQQQLLQGPSVNPQQQQQPVAVRPPPMQQPQAAQRPSQQATQLLSQQGQRQQPAVQHGVGPGSGRMQPAAPGRPQPPPQHQQHQQPHRPEVQGPPPQQHQQQNCPPQNLWGGAASGRAAAGPAPLQQHNGDAAPAGGAKRSRLALAKAPTQAPSEPAAADFGFAQPPQHQPGAQPGGPARGRLAAPNQLAQRLRQAGGGLAAGGAGAAAAAAAAGAVQGAGTDDDPICLDEADEQQQPQPGSSGAVEASGDVAMAAADEPAGWDGEDGWEEGQAALGGPHLDPWEQGYEVAEDEEQLPDADQPDGGGWQDGEDWQAEDGWQDGEDAMEEDPAAGASEQQEGQGHGAAEAAAAADDDDGGSWDDGVDAAEDAAPQAAPPAGAGNAAAGAAVRQPAGKRRSSGSAVEVPRQSSRRQQHNASDGASHPGRPAKQQQLQQQSPVQSAQQQGKVPAAAVTPVGDASTISSTLGLADLTVQQASDRAQQAPLVPAAAAAAAQQPEQQQQPQQPEQQLASPAARLGALAVPQLEALSPSLLGAAPTLAEVLYSKPAAAAVEAVAPAAAVAVGSGSSGRAVPSVPALRGAPQRPALASGRSPLRLLSVSAPSAAAAAATRPAAAASRPAAAPAAPAVSDDDMPAFALLDDMSPVRAQHGAAPAAAVAASEDEPFIYLLELHRRAASAGPASFPLAARIFGTIRGINGKLGFTNPHTGQPEYTMNLEIEDGSLLVPARLGTQFMREFFDVEPLEFQALLADPARKLEGVELAKGLQKLLSSYSGLIEVELEAPGRPLLVRNIGQELRGEEVAALQRRAAGG